MLRLPKSGACTHRCKRHPHGRGIVTSSFIQEQEMRAGERIDFLNAVILRLILNGSKEDLIRAHIFDYYMRIGFDFDQLSIEDQEKRTK